MHPHADPAAALVRRVHRRCRAATPRPAGSRTSRPPSAARPAVPRPMLRLPGPTLYGGRSCAHDGDSASSGVRARPDPCSSLALMVTIAFGTAATASGAAAAPTGCAPVTIAQENARPGGTGWVPPPPPRPRRCRGREHHERRLRRARHALSRDTRPRHRCRSAIAAWRLGYCHGAGGRLVWTSGIGARRAAEGVGNDRARDQHGDAHHGAPSLSFTVPHTWTQGVYELRIDPLCEGPACRDDSACRPRRGCARPGSSRRCRPTPGRCTTPGAAWTRTARTAHVARREPQPTVRRLRDGAPDDRRLSDRPPCRGARTRHVVCDRPGSRSRCQRDRRCAGARVRFPHRVLDDGHAPRSRPRLPTVPTRSSWVPTTCTGGPSRSVRPGPIGSSRSGRCRPSTRTRRTPRWRRSSGATPDQPARAGPPRRAVRVHQRARADDRAHHPRMGVCRQRRHPGRSLPGVIYQETDTPAAGRCPAARVSSRRWPSHAPRTASRSPGVR